MISRVPFVLGVAAEVPADTLADFIAYAKRFGYHKLSAFAKVGPSLHNVKKLGMTELEVKRNFYNTGDTYVLCAMDL